MAEPAADGEFDPDRPWSSADIAALSRDEVAEALRFNYGVDVLVTADIDSLRSLLEELESNPPRQGVIRWVRHGEDDLVLYERERALLGRKVEQLAASIATWGDLQAAATGGDEVGALLLDGLALLWDNERYWAFGLDDDDPRIAESNSFQAFMARATKEEPLEIELESEGEPTLWMCDPMDPSAMGVPPLIVDRYYGEESNMLSSWSTLPIWALSDVKRTLRSLGWDLEEGTAVDLPGA